MEMQITTDLQTAIPQEIVFNFEELETELAERLHHYNTLVVTEDGIREGKADRAKLVKLREAIETRRKEVKKQCMQPYTDFEAKVKKLTALIDAPIAAIDSQLREYEEMRREEKQKQIEETYAALVPEELQTIIPLARIADPKWLNSTTTMKKVREDIVGQVNKVEADMLALDSVSAEYAAAVRAKYIETLDLASALNHQKALQAAAEAFHAAGMSQPVQEAAPAAEPSSVADIAPAAPSDPAEPVYVLRLEMHLTKSQANALKTFLTENNIEHTKI